MAHTAGFLFFDAAGALTTDMSADYKVKIDRITKALWSAALQEFADASIYQTWSYGAVRWGEKNLSHLVLRRDGEVVGMAQAVIKKVPFFQAGIAYIPWAPLWRVKGVKPDIGIFREVLRAVKEEYAGKRGLLVRVSPNEVSTATGEIVSALAEKGFKKTSQLYRTLLVDVRPPLDALRKNLDQKWRNQLNRAEKNGLEVVDGTSDDLFSNFLSLYNELLERKQFETHVDVEEFRRIQKYLEEQSKMHIFLCFSEGRPVATLVGSAMGDRGIYLLGATNDEGMKTKGSYLLQWRMIQWLKEFGCAWYDLGGIDPDGNPGVYHFKAGLSGRDIQHVGQFDYSRSWLSSTLVSAGQSLKKHRRGAGNWAKDSAT